MNRKLKFVQTHTVLFIPNLGQFKTSLTPDSKEFPGMSLEYSADGIVGKYKGVSFIIPLANVVCAIFADEVRPVVSAKSA